MNEDQNQKQQENPLKTLADAQKNKIISSLVKRAAVSVLGAVGWPVIIGVAAVVFFTILIAVITGGPSDASDSSATSIDTTKTNLGIHFYCQYDTTWSGNSCDIVHYGCDPTSLAMVFSSFGDTKWTPSYTAISNGSMGCFGATTENQTISAINNMSALGYTKGPNLAISSNFNLSSAKEYISKGYLIHAAANIFYREGGSFDAPILSSGGHSFIITGVDQVSQTITILDPTYCNSDTNYVTKTVNVFRDVLSDSNGDGWFWAYPIKKVGTVQ